MGLARLTARVIEIEGTLDSGGLNMSIDSLSGRGGDAKGVRERVSQLEHTTDELRRISDQLKQKFPEQDKVIESLQRQLRKLPAKPDESSVVQDAQVSPGRIPKLKKK